MTMNDKLTQIENRVEQVLSLVEELRVDNRKLREQNESLKAEMAELRREFDTLQLTHNDQTGAVRSRLTSVLNRIEELESLSQ